jgi:hypothetical protein
MFPSFRRRRHRHRPTPDRGYAPQRFGPMNALLSGFVLPIALIWYASKGYLQESIVWHGRGGGITLKGESAKAMALCYLSAAGLVHFSGFWLERSYRIFAWGAILSVVLWAAGCGEVIYREF